MSSSRIKTHNLNVSDRYVPNWGPWEVVREIVTNAMDACSDWELTTHSTDHVTIHTSTAPRLGDILVIGQGTKELGGISIGQFGEGLKLAALTCVRSGGTFEVVTPDGLMKFFLKELPEYDANVLHCEIDSDGESCTEGCYVNIIMMDVGMVSNGRFLKDTAGRRLKKISSGYLNLFVKGVWISRSEESSLHDWNLVDATINRDRNVVERASVCSEVCDMMCINLCVSEAEDLIRNPEVFEVRCMSHCYFPSIELKSMFKAAFHAIHGERAVISVIGNDRANEYAVLKGYNVVGMPAHELERFLTTVKTSAQLVPSTVTKTQLDKLRVQSDLPVIRDIRRLLDRLKFPIELCVFRDSNQLPENYAGDVTSGGPTGIQIWLKEEILACRKDAIESVLLFASAARTTNPNSSLQFEGSMASLSAAIAEAWLDDVNPKGADNAEDTSNL